jgi:hypothetical protein
MTRHPTPHTDSAGVPWAGRTLNPQPFAGDTGEPDPGLAAALAGHAEGRVPIEDVVAALAPTRLMVAVVATEEETAVDPATGLPVDSRADMALVTLTGRDGRRALPVFSGVAELAGWDSRARPVPVEAARAAQSCVAEGCDLLLLDPAGPVTVLLPRPAVWALGQGRPWLPSPADPEVAAAVSAALSGIRGVHAVDCLPGHGAELRVRLLLEPGLDRSGLDALLASAGERLAAEPLVAERVDSLELAPEQAPDGAGPG